MKREYCSKYDAYYNPRSGRFLEANCGDKNCKICKDRPATHPDFCECTEVCIPDPPKPPDNPCYTLGYN